MNQQIIEEAKQLISNNMKYYAQYFMRRNLNDIFIFVLEILERKLLNINGFVYYIHSSLSQMLNNFSFYAKLSKQKRKNLEYYHTNIIKIFMYLNAIFYSLNEMKDYNKKILNKS